MTRQTMRVLHINPDMDLGGAQTVLADMLPYLVKEGVETIVASTGGCFVERIERNGAQHVIAPVAGKAPWQVARACRALSAIIREWKPDLVRADAVVPGLAARRAIDGLSGSKPPLLMCMHGFWDTEFSGARRLTLPFLYPVLNRAADHILAVCEPFKESLKAHGIPENKITVVESGVDLSTVAAATPREQIRTEWGLTDRDIVVGFVGRMARQKLLPDLVDAAPDVLREEPNARFVLVGDGPDRRSIEMRAEKQGVADRFRFLGSRPNVHQVLPGFDLFVLPSLWEGLPMALLEAMLHARPCVVTAVTGNNVVTVDGESALWVPLKDPAGIARAIVRLIRDPDLARSLGEGAARRVRERFSVERTACKTVELYRRLVDDAKR